jgi:hypothetical protein
MDNLTMLEANHFRRIAQLALDFNLDAKMAYEGEAAPPELESLNRRVRLPPSRSACHASVRLTRRAITRPDLASSEEIWLRHSG